MVSNNDLRNDLYEFIKKSVTDSMILKDNVLKIKISHDGWLIKTFDSNKMAKEFFDQRVSELTSEILNQYTHDYLNGN